MTALPVIDAALASRLVAAQFPQWAGRTITPVARSGWDNRSFRLGDDLLLRLPSAEAYAAAVTREQRWLPHLAPKLPLAIPAPVAQGVAGSGYPWAWSVLRWIEGETIAVSPPKDTRQLAVDLGAFLRALRAASAEGAPPAGPASFHRGGSLGVYDGECRDALQQLCDECDTASALALWDAALATRWTSAPVWVHGDIAPGNLLVRGGRLVAVIDFGQLCAGDPACDAAIAWTLFRGQDRAAFKASLGVDDATWQRGRAWALWKAAIVASGLCESHAAEAAAARPTLREIIAEADGDTSPEH